MSETTGTLSKDSRRAGDIPVARSGGRILAEALRLHGTDRVFIVPGESYLDALDALYDLPEIQVIVAKHEGAAANMAEADGKLTGRPGICFVTRGPGATHAAVGVHTAKHDSTPMILFIGQVSRAHRGRECFQEIDFAQMFAPFAKWTVEIDDARRIPEILLRAFQCATSGRPGPVVISLPEDVLSDEYPVADTAPFTPVQAAPKPEDLAALRSRLEAAERPLLILGGSTWSAEAWDAVAAFAAANVLPVMTSFRRQDLFDNDHPNYAGHIAIGFTQHVADRVRAADLIVALGTRLTDAATSEYTTIEAPRPAQTLVHIYPDPNELGRVYQPDLSINAGAAAFASALRPVTPIVNPPWRAWTEDARRQFVEYTAVRTDPALTGVSLAAVMSHLATRLPADAHMCSAAGNFAVWVHRYFRYKRFRTELAPTSGAMGYGVPAAIASKLRFPGRMAVCVTGDGDFLMYPQELATAKEFGASLIVLIVNNGMYGTIRMHQERHFPGRVIGTNLEGPDYVALARSFGAFGEKVESTDAFPAAFERAVASKRLAVLELVTDPKQLTPDRRMS